MEEYNKEDLEFFLPDSFKGLSKDYIIECIFDEDIQKNWTPGIGDVIVGPTGNIFVISNTLNLNKSIGGKMYFYGGGLCNRDGGIVMNSTHCYTANESGKYYDPLKGEQDNPYHSSIRKFKFIPYPHERKK